MSKKTSLFFFKTLMLSPLSPCLFSSLRTRCLRNVLRMNRYQVSLYSSSSSEHYNSNTHNHNHTHNYNYNYNSNTHAHTQQQQQQQDSSARHENNKPSQTSLETPQTKAFKELLDSLLDRPFAQMNTPKPEPLKDYRAQFNSGAARLIEQRLLDMVIQKKAMYKEKAPLARSMIGPFATVPFKATHHKGESASVKRSKAMLEHKVSDSLSVAPSSCALVELVVELVWGHEVSGIGLPRDYDHIVNTAINTAAFRLGDPYLAVTLFEQAKFRSVESYLAGCTVEVYNTMLNIRWEMWRDVHGMIELVEEMMSNGIDYDEETKEIVKRVSKHVLGDLQLVQESTVTDQHGVSQKDKSHTPPHSQSAWSADETRVVNIMVNLVGRWMLH